MLQTIRDHLTGWVAILLFTLIGLAFAFWGVGNYGLTGTAAVAQVNGNDIPLEEIRRAYRGQVSQYQQLYNELPPELEQQVRNQVLEGMVRDEVLSQHTRKAGYRIGDKQLEVYVKNIPAFQDEGQFSLDRYRSQLSLQGIAPQYFEEQIRRFMRVNQLQQAVSQTAFVTPDQIERRVRLEREQRRADWANIGVGQVADEVEVTDDDVAAHYADNPDSYMRPESVDIEYILIDAGEIASAMDVTDEDLRAYYDQEIAAGRFVAPPERRARHILIAVDDDADDSAARAEAQQLMERLQAGEDFAALAQEASDDPGSAPEGGDLGWAQSDAYVGPFADALFSMAEGDLSGPVRTDFGYHVIRLDGIRGGEAKPFDELYDELKAELSRNRSDDEFFDLTELAADLSFENPDSLEPIADELGLEIQRLDGLTRTPGEGLAGSRAVIDAAFSDRVAEERENSDLLKPDDQSRVVLRVLEYYPRAVRPFEEVADAIRAELELERARNLAQERGEALLARVTAGETLADVAAELGADYTGPEAYRRTAGLPPALRDAIFTAPKPAAGDVTRAGVTLADGSYAVFALTEVVPGDTANLPPPDQYALQAGQGDLAAYIAALQNRADIVLRPELLE